MSESTEVERVESAVPALVNTPAVEITAEDVALPRLYLGQYMSDHVQEDRVPAGCIFTASGADDPDPQVLWEQDDEGGVIVHVLAMRKGKSITDGGELVLFQYDDPEAPQDAWVTYNYVIALPEVDTDVPHKWLLTRTGKPAAQQINTVIAKNSGIVPPTGLAFEVTATQRSNKKGKFFVPRVRPVDADPEHVAVAEKLATLISSDVATAQSSSEEPAI